LCLRSYKATSVSSNFAAAAQTLGTQKQPNTAPLASSTRAAELFLSTRITKFFFSFVFLINQGYQMALLSNPNGCKSHMYAKWSLSEGKLKHEDKTKEANKY